MKRTAMRTWAIWMASLAVAYGIDSPLAKPEKYVFTKPNATNAIEGRVMGWEPSYRSIRREDVAFIWEAVCERQAMADGRWNFTNEVEEVRTEIVRGEFPLSYTNRYAQTLTDVSGQFVSAYYTVTTNTNVVAKAGVDTRELKELEFTLPTAYRDPDAELLSEAVETNAYEEIRALDLPPTQPSLSPPPNTAALHLWPRVSNMTNIYMWIARSTRLQKMSQIQAASNTVNHETRKSYSGTEIVERFENVGNEEDPIYILRGTVEDVANFGGGHAETNRNESSGVNFTAYVFVQEHIGYKAMYRRNYDQTSGYSYEEIYNAGPARNIYIETAHDEGTYYFDTGIDWETATRGGVMRVAEVTPYLMTDVSYTFDRYHNQSDKGQSSDTNVQRRITQVLVPIDKSRVTIFETTNRTVGAAARLSSLEVATKAAAAVGFEWSTSGAGTIDPGGDVKPPKASEIEGVGGPEYATIIKWWGGETYFTGNFQANDVILVIDLNLSSAIPRPPKD